MTGTRSVVAVIVAAAVCVAGVVGVDNLTSGSCTPVSIDTQAVP